MGQKCKRFREFRTPFSLRDIRKKSSQHVRACAAGDGAICSKNRKIAPFIIGPTPILQMARAYGLRPRLWLLSQINSDLKYIDRWLKANELSLRSEFMVISSRQKLQSLNDYTMNIHIDGVPINQSS